VEVDPGVPRVKAVELMLREALANYITNAVKYTPPGGHIKVRVLNRPPAVRVEVEDDGIGISSEDQARLFGEFVRLKSKHQEVAKAKGSGLGLTIVKRVAVAHNGRYGVVSRDGEGSTFFFELDA